MTKDYSPVSVAAIKQQQASISNTSKAIKRENSSKVQNPESDSDKATKKQKKGSEKGPQPQKYIELVQCFREYKENMNKGLQELYYQTKSIMQKEIDQLRAELLATVAAEVKQEPKPVVQQQTKVPSEPKPVASPKPVGGKDVVKKDESSSQSDEQASQPDPKIPTKPKQDSSSQSSSEQEYNKQAKQQSEESSDPSPQRPLEPQKIQIISKQPPPQQHQQIQKKVRPKDDSSDDDYRQPVKQKTASSPVDPHEIKKRRGRPPKGAPKITYDTKIAVSEKNDQRLIKKREIKVVEKESSDSDGNKPRLVGPPRKITYDDNGNPIIRKRGRPPKNPSDSKNVVKPYKPSPEERRQQKASMLESMLEQEVAQKEHQAQNEGKFEKQNFGSPPQIPVKVTKADISGSSQSDSSNNKGGSQSGDDDSQ